MSDVASATIHPPYLARFSDGLAYVLKIFGIDPDTVLRAGRIGIAVSGGADSMALLVLAEACMPGRVLAATVDHGLRPAGALEARAVNAFCWERHIPHEILAVAVRGPGGIQAAARRARYSALDRWARRSKISVVATAHHVDDQAETVLMRLARGSGVDGLAGIRPARRMGWLGSGSDDDPSCYSNMILARPVLDFTSRELSGIARRAGVPTIDDPSNVDPRFDRTQARRLLSQTEWLSARRLAATAAHLRDASEALNWALGQAIATRVERPPSSDLSLLDPSGLPAEILRRIVRDLLDGAEVVATFGARQESPATGPELTRLIERASAGITSTIGNVQVRGGAKWKFRPLWRSRGPN